MTPPSVDAGPRGVERERFGGGLIEVGTGHWFRTRAGAPMACGVGGAVHRLTVVSVRLRVDLSVGVSFDGR